MVHIYRICYQGKEWFGAYDFEPEYKRVIYDYYRKTDIVRYNSFEHFTLEVRTCS